MGIRPLGIALERILLPGSDLQVTLVPLVALIIICSAVPTHLEYYKSQSGQTQNAQAKIYLQQLFLVIGLVIILCGAGFMFSGKFMSAFFLCFLVFYLLEKVVDELQRKFEFQKQMYLWFLLQFFRSTWVIAPILLAYFGIDYELAFWALGLMMLSGTLIFFFREFPVFILPSRVALQAIMQKSVYLFGNFTMGGYRQGPRLYVAASYPDFAHLYLIVSQIVQTFNIAYNAKLQIPYRKIIAQKTRLVFNRVTRVNRMLITGIVFVACVFLAVPGFQNANASPLSMTFLLFPILAGEAVLAAMLAAMIGYIQWGISIRGFAMASAYLACIAGALVFVFTATGLNQLVSTNILYLPALNCLLGALLIACMAEFYRRMEKVPSND